MWGTAVYRVQTARIADLLVVGAATLHAALIAGALSGVLPMALLAMVTVPWLGLAAVILTDAQMDPAHRAILELAGLVGIAAAVAVVAGRFGVAAAGAPFGLVALWLVARHPVPALGLAFLLTGTFGTLPAYVSFPNAPVIDVVLAGILAGTVVGWLFGGRRRAAWLWPGVVLMGLYVVLTGFAVLFVEDRFTALQSFRQTTWLLGAAFVVAYAPWKPGVRQRLAYAFVGVCLLVGTYSAVRWVTGPASAEEEFARTFFNNFLDGELRAVGSFPTSKALAAWMATVVPFCFAATLWMRGIWRLLAVAALGACTLAMLAPDVRAGVAAAVPACAIVLALYALSPAFGPRRIMISAVAGLTAVGIAIGGFTLTLADGPRTADRYTAILNPTEDEAVQARLFKWETALATIDENPLGQGVGTAGGNQVLSGRFSTLANIDVDNSYLRIGLEQGFYVMVLFGVAMLALLGGLARRALTVTDPARAGLIIGATGVLVSMLALFVIGNYMEGLTALPGWLLIGLGLGQTVWRARPDEVL